MKKLSKSDFTEPSIGEIDEQCKWWAAIDEAMYWALRIRLQRKYGMASPK